METFLFIITVLSLGAAAALAFVVQKLKQQNQLRSDARVAVLMSAANDAPVTSRSVEPTRDSGAWTPVAGEWQWNPSTVGEFVEESHDLHPRPTAQPASRFERRPAFSAGAAEGDTHASTENLFGTAQREAPVLGRLAFAGALALVAVLGGAAIIYSASGHVKHATEQATQRTPLELVSLGHAREANTLTISGIVRNPQAGAKLEGLTAVVSLIDEHGGLISTKDVPLDYRALGPGEEAPFKVSVPDPGSVARYRVSFRAGTDVVPHVDRRTDTKLASAL